MSVVIDFSNLGHLAIVGIIILLLFTSGLMAYDGNRFLSVIVPALGVLMVGIGFLGLLITSLI